MDKKKFRWLIVLRWLLVVGVMLAVRAAKHSLPSELQPYLNAPAKPLQAGGNDFVSLLQIILGAVGSIIGVVSGICIYWFKDWARYVFGLAFLGGTLITMFSGQQFFVETAWVFSLRHLLMFLDGAIVALAFFSPVNEAFLTKRE